MCRRHSSGEPLELCLRTGFPGSGVYRFTKGAVAAMVKGIVLDLAPRRITVNNVQPGPTNTDINSGAIDALSEKSPLKRVAGLKEIAGLVSYLAKGRGRLHDRRKPDD
ncbi:hypothetical protein ASD03_32475 [Ensifer sp. Root127]|nr:hypothetical protein ASD03_32475 [Ensifer sp. Root127]